MRIIKRAANTIEKEEAHGGSGARKVYSSSDYAKSRYFDAITHGFLPGNATFDWHSHSGIEETMVVLKGHGFVADRDGEYEYAPGDVFIFPADVEHMIHNPENEEHEMLFVRVRA